MTTLPLSGLDRFPRLPLLDGPTPIQRLGRLEARLGDALRGVRLYVKRDDHIALGGGGNKLRKLEFLLGQAVTDGADTIITMGGLQSNHARLTAAACARAGLACELVLPRLVPRDDADYEHSGNVLLDRLFGATVHALPGTVSALEWAERRALELRAQGRSVAVLPTGGSTPLGSLGYVACAQEIVTQARQMDVEFAQIALANGSSGTHAGLAAGLAALGLPASLVRSYAVLIDGETTQRKTSELARTALALLDGANTIAETDIDVDGSQRGPYYGAPTEAMIAAVRALAGSEGLLLDPVYSGKAFAGLLADIKNGRYQPGQNVLFVMTGGAPGLYAYRSIFE
ncbi:D-cysteine desulfhydrase family protein [Janthinobacterium agaricidamnosum]|uniref:Pyridoxal-phosphate dependent enzyme family protein n=1 Tax=Janthinobacterium agaricidamnosum NBRC 102515 = DSM 9628 TaxID=1349767 RepID=W0VDX5_9BURK|nr:D-cysteine desulfhydrase family protein [Janthinobacterium agaricidamnosum]CDG85487.1 pyridoxal-phosphate dependent enzyme family protein [Janthinobacterium agaricidamnosum NBRC 102515 = DSM 9628]